MDNTESLVCKDCKKPFECTAKWRKTYGFWCQDCKREYTRKNLTLFRHSNPEKIKAYKAAFSARPDYKEMQRRWNAARTQRWRDFLIEQKTKPCADCGNTYHHTAMEFDHVANNKFACIGHLKSAPRDVVLAEIAKCELVCAICHRLRTNKRRNNGRSAIQPASSADGSIQLPS